MTDIKGHPVVEGVIDDATVSAALADLAAKTGDEWRFTGVAHTSAEWWVAEFRRVRDDMISRRPAQGATAAFEATITAILDGRIWPEAK